MESPVVVENPPQFNQPNEQINTGFPFDDSDYDSSSDHLQSRLDDIAARHPEFATHFRGLDDFPTFRRKRHTSGEQEEAGASSSGSSRFPSGFNRFPFTSRFEDDFAQEPSRGDKPPEVPKQEKRGRKPNPYLPQHLSNTVDLGQKTPANQESRNQRSMSAPPENRSQNTREEEEQPNMGKTFSRQPPPQSQASQPKERIIPIHVEGRDDPVMPKNPNFTAGGGNTRYHQATPPRQQSANQQQTPPPQWQPSANQQQAPPQQWSANQQQAPPPQWKDLTSQQQMPPPNWKEATNQQQTTPPRQQTPTNQQQAPPTKQATPPPPPMSNDPLDKIKSVRSNVMDLMTSVENFAGTRKDKEYLYLDEMLTRNLLKLDNVETEGKENIRLARKEAIKCIQTCINNLEAKAQAKEKQLLKSGETVKQETTAPETEEEQKQTETVEPPKFTSQATLIISAPKIIDEQPVEKMEVEPVAIETKPETADSQETTEQKVEAESSQTNENSAQK